MPLDCIVQQTVDATHRMLRKGFPEMVPDLLSYRARIHRRSFGRKSPGLGGQEFGVAQSIRQPGQASAQHRLNDRDTEELMASGRQDPVTACEMPKVRLSILDPPIVLDPVAMSLTKGLHRVGNHPRPLPHQDEAQVETFCKAISDLKQLIRTLVMRTPMRPGDSDTVRIIGLFRVT